MVPLKVRVRRLVGTISDGPYDEWLDAIAYRIEGGVVSVIHTDGSIGAFDHQDVLVQRPATIDDWPDGLCRKPVHAADRVRADQTLQAVCSCGRDIVEMEGRWYHGGVSPNMGGTTIAGPA